MSEAPKVTVQKEPPGETSTQIVAVLGSQPKPFTIANTPIFGRDTYCQMICKPAIPFLTLRHVLSFQSYPFPSQFAPTPHIMTPTIPSAFKQRNRSLMHNYKSAYSPYGTYGSHTTAGLYQQLEHAVAVNNVERVNKLLMHRPSQMPNLLDLLHAAARRGYPDMVAILMRHGAKPNDLDSFGGNTPLHLAVSAPQMNARFKEVVAHLLAAGADILIKDRNGYTPIDLVIEKLKTIKPQVDDQVFACYKMVLAMMWRCYEKKKKLETDLLAISESMKSLTTTDEEKLEADALWAKVQTMSLK